MRVLITLIIGLTFSVSKAQLPACEWCGTSEAPSSVGSHTMVVPLTEPGERIFISGKVYQEDGVTPAPNVMIYVYHTNVAGKYPKRNDLTGNGQRHGYLRGWMKTDARGAYSFETIYPGYYPGNNSEPSHIHYVLQPPGWEEYWIASLLFEGDDRVMEQNLDEVEREGGFSNIVNLEFNNKGYREGERNIILKRY